MAPKRRKTNKHLPARVYLKHGAYFYVDVNNKWHNLGKAYPEAMKNYAELTSGRVLKNNSMHSIFDRYLKEIAPTKAKTTYKREIYAIKYLKTAFGHLKPSDITALLIYQYLDIRSASPFAANKEKAVLSCILNYAIRWGMLERNPCNDVKPLSTTRRNRYVTDEEYKSVYSIASPLIRVAMDIACATGLRQGDILRLQRSNLTPEGIRMVINKTGRKKLFCWNPHLRAIIESAKNLRSPLNSMYLICTKKGQPYTSEGFKAIWKRTVKKAISQGLLQEHFNFHDLRRKAATDAEKLSGREYARNLLDHSTQQTTSRYIQGETIVEPLSSPVLLDKQENIRQAEKEHKKTG